MHKTILTFTIFLLPLVSSAYTPPSRPETVNDLLGMFTFGLSKWIVPLLLSLALFLFMYGIIKFISSGDNEEARTKGRNMMIFGIITLFVMVSVWGLVNILSQSFFQKDADTPNYLPKPIGQSQQ